MINRKLINELHTFNTFFTQETGCPTIGTAAQKTNACKLYQTHS